MATPSSIALTLYEERLKNDAFALRQLMHERATWEVVGFGKSTTMTYAADKYPSSMAAFIDEVISTWRWISFNFLDILADDNRLFCRYNLQAEYMPKNHIYSSTSSDFFRIEGGYIRDVISYPNPKLNFGPFET